MKQKAKRTTAKLKTISWSKVMADANHALSYPITPIKEK